MPTAESIERRERASLERSTSHLAVNVGEAERLASKVGGGVLVGVGLGRGGWPGVVLAGLGAVLYHRGATGHCALYTAIGADTTEGEGRGPADSVPAQAGVHVVESITIDRSADDLFRFWRDYANLPRFMGDIESVAPTSSTGLKSRWVAKGPMDKTLEWDAEIINEAPGELIAWRSTGGDLETAGSVHFQPAPGGHGTEVRVEQKINPPGGKLGAAIAALLGHGFASVTRENLRRLKQIMETSESVAVSGSPSSSV